MSFQPGSFFWLVAHDLRLGWRRFRGLFGSLRSPTVALIIVIGLAVFHAIAWPIAKWFAGLGQGDQSARLLYPALGSATLFVMPWLISQALTNSTRALYSRGDLDLLLASPVPARNILAAHAFAIAIESFGSVVIFLAPIANMNALLNGPHWLAIYPALIASAFFATALGLCLTLALFVVIGPRLTRTVSQVMATIIGAGFVLALQVMNVLPEHIRDGIIASIDTPTPGSIFDRHGPLWLPVRAAAGEWRDLLIWCVVAGLFFTLAAATLGRKFAASAIRTNGEPTRKRPERQNRQMRMFRAGIGKSLRMKEWRLLARDPWLMSQILLQVIYTLPVAIVVWRSQGHESSIGISVAPAIVVISSQIAASLAWLAISSEDAPDFLATAPITRPQVERRKLEAIGVPLALFLALPIVGLAYYSVETALITAIFCAAAAASTALLNLWHPMPGRRTQVLRRHSQSKLVGVMEHMLSLFWAVAMVLAALGSALALLAIGGAVGVLWFNQPRPPAEYVRIIR